MAIGFWLLWHQPTALRGVDRGALLGKVLIIVLFS